MHHVPHQPRHGIEHDGRVAVANSVLGEGDLGGRGDLGERDLELDGGLGEEASKKSQV